MASNLVWKIVLPHPETSIVNGFQNIDQLKNVPTFFHSRTQLACSCTERNEWVTTFHRATRKSNHNQMKVLKSVCMCVCLSVCVEWICRFYRPRLTMIWEYKNPHLFSFSDPWFNDREPSKPSLRTFSKIILGNCKYKAKVFHLITFSQSFWLMKFSFKSNWKS